MAPGSALPDDPLVEEVRTAARRLDLPRRYRELDRAPAFPRAEFRALGEAGLLGLHFAPTMGGRGLPLPRVGAVLFHLAYLGGTTFAKLSLQPEFSSVLAEHGAPELVDRWFRPMLHGEHVVGNQITEPGAGSDALALTTTATPEAHGYRLDGEKSEVAFAQDAAAAIVYAHDPGAPARRRITAFLVPQDLPGIERGEPSGDLGERWQRRANVRYRGVRVPDSLRLGDEGAGYEYLRAELDREHALLAAIYLGVARASWDETIEHVGRREAFGRPLAAQEAVAFPLVIDGAELDATWSYALRALGRLEHGEPAGADAALAKWMATEVALRTIDHAIQFHGGRGYSQSLPHEQRWRDVRSGRIAHGTSEIMLRVGARELWPRSRPSS